MSTMTPDDRPGLLERLTNSTAFAVLFGIAATVLAPVVLLGLTVLPGMVLRDTGLADKAVLLLPIGGVIGYVGLFRARRPSRSRRDYWATLVCLGVGIATAVMVVCGVLFAIGGDADLRSVEAIVVLRVAGAIVVLSLPIIAGLGDIARLRRLRATAEGRVLDSLPLIFLWLALAEAACAIAIGVQLAAAG